MPGHSTYAAISCIIPTYNRGHLIGEAIKSVLNQDYPEPVEIIVVDDCSTDNTAGFVNSAFPQVRIIKNSRNLGPGHSRNIGSSAATGRYLMFLDSDDTWLPHHVQSLMSLFDAGAMVAYGTALCHDETDCTQFTIPEEGKAPVGWCTDALLGWCHMVPSAFALARNVFEETGGFPHMRFGEDWRFFLKLSRLYQFDFCGTVITRRRLHNGSICASGSIQQRAAKLIRAMLDDVSECCKSPHDDKIVSSLHTHLEHVEKEGHLWETVQDWYMSLKRHALV